MRFLGEAENAVAICLVFSPPFDLFGTARPHCAITHLDAVASVCGPWCEANGHRLTRNTCVGESSSMSSVAEVRARLAGQLSKVIENPGGGRCVRVRTPAVV